MRKFTSHGFDYEIQISGAIKQLEPQPFTYDDKYCATYDTEAYSRGNAILQALRLGFAEAAHGCRISSIADIGYGNGAFLKFAKLARKILTGYDVTGVEVDGVNTYKISNHVDMAHSMLHHEVVTFFDCLEHIEDHNFLRILKCETLIVSLPFCHAEQYGVEWFSNGYIHRKPNEHIWHFSFAALVNHMNSFGWKVVAASDFEDIIRVSKHGDQNILTCAFKKH